MGFRLGVRSVVLEQAESLRTGGASITLFKNGWRALDAIGVANDLRTQFLEIQGYACFFFYSTAHQINLMENNEQNSMHKS